MPERLGISVMAWNRPYYLKQCLDSLAANDLTDCDVHLWQDGAVCHITGKRLTCDGLIDESEAVFAAASLPRKQAHRQQRNIGVAAQRATLMPWMAEHYEQFFCLDDDVILGPHCVAMIRKALAQFADDPRVVSISPGMRLKCPPGQWRQHLDAVTFPMYHAWADAYWRDKWALMWPGYMAYYDIIKSYPYRQFSEYADKVAAWAQPLGMSASVSSDESIARAAKMAGMKRWCFVVNRATGIGDYGINCRPDLVDLVGHSMHQPIYAPDEELEIERFRVVEIET